MGNEMWGESRSCILYSLSHIPDPDHTVSQCVLETREPPHPFSKGADILYCSVCLFLVKGHLLGSCCCTIATHAVVRDVADSSASHALHKGCSLHQGHHCMYVSWQSPRTEQSASSRGTSAGSSEYSHTYSSRCVCGVFQSDFRHRTAGSRVKINTSVPWVETAVPLCISEGEHTCLLSA